jgi:putative Holliday junction resolvase
MRAAAVDFGTVRVGLAVADELGLLAHPRPYLDGRDPQRLVEELALLARSEGIELFLVGLPRSLDGKEGVSARRARKLASSLKKASGTRVVMVDEWLTTREAAGRLRAQGLDERAQRSRIDSAAAAVLLQSYLDRGRRGGR